MLGTGAREVGSVAVVAVIFAGSLVIGMSTAAANDPILVTITSDVVDAGDGETSLREAITAANAAVGADEVVLLAGMTHLLTDCLPGGDGLVLDSDAITITGGGATVAVPCSSNAFDGQAGGGAVTVTDLTINGAARALITRGRAIELDGVTLTGNDIGLDAVGALVDVTDSTIADNRSIGVLLGDGFTIGGTYTIDRTTISDNGIKPTTVRSAGGLSIESGLLFLFSSTVTANHGDVGGVFVGGDGYLLGSTVAGNAGTELDDLHIEGTAVIGNSIVGDDDDASPNCLLDILPGSAGSNLDADGSCGFHMTSDLIGVDPRLLPLADNGGPTRTRLPHFTSPALDAMSTCVPTADQRGVARPQGAGCDIGAVELEAEGIFTDVGSAHPFFWEIACLADLEVTEGYPDGTFRPTETITRQATIAWIWRLEGSPAPSGPPTFPDVPPSHPFADAIAWAEEQGIAEGFPDGTFRPGRRITRQAAAQWLWEAVGTFPIEPASFVDVPMGHPFFVPISWLAEAGITSGFPDNTFRPADLITRQALAAWVCRASVSAPA
jgi:hypothetical protein